MHYRVGGILVGCCWFVILATRVSYVILWWMDGILDLTAVYDWKLEHEIYCYCVWLELEQKRHCRVSWCVGLKKLCRHWHPGSPGAWSWLTYPWLTIRTKQHRSPTGVSPYVGSKTDFCKITYWNQCSQIWYWYIILMISIISQAAATWYKLIASAPVSILYPISLSAKRIKLWTLDFVSCHMPYSSSLIFHTSDSS